MNWTILDGDYYISPISGDDSGTGTSQRPFKTVARALAFDYSSGNIAGKKFIIEGGMNIAHSFAYTGRTWKKFVSDGEKGLLNSVPGIINTDEFHNFKILNIGFASSMNGFTFHNCHLIDCRYSYNATSNIYLYNCLVVRWATSNPTGQLVFNGNFNTYYNCSAASGGGYRFTGHSCYVKSCSGYANSLTYSLVDSPDENFVDVANFNFNILSGSALAYAGKPDSITNIPTNIGCGKVVNSFNGSNLGGTHNGTAFDIDNNLVLNGTKVGEFTSSVLDVGAVKNIRSIMFNQLKEWNVSGFPLKFCGGEKWFKSLPVVSATSNTLVMPTSYLISSDYFSGSSDTYVRIISGTGASFTRNPSASASSGQAVIPISNTSGVYLGQSISGTGIPANTTVSSINDNTSITLSANLTSGLTTSSVLTFSRQRNQVTALNATTGEMSLSSNWQITPDATSIFEFYRTPVNLNTFEVRWSSVSEADVSTQVWCKMIIGNDIKFSMFSGNRVGIGDDNFDAISSEYIRARWFQIIVKLHDLS